MHNKSEWDSKHFDKNYYEKSEKTPYGGFLVEYTWENFQQHAGWKVRFLKHHFQRFGFRSILFGGCAKGFEVKAAIHAGYDAFGIDISEYALSKVDPEVRNRCFLGSMVDMKDFKENEFDIFASFDVWHTVHPDDRDKMACEISRVAKKGICIRTGFLLTPSIDKKYHLTGKEGEVELDYAESLDPAFNNIYDGNPAYQDSIGLFIKRFEKIGKFRLFYAPVVWDRDFFIWYCLCRADMNLDSIIKTYGGTGDGL